MDPKKNKKSPYDVDLKMHSVPLFAVNDMQLDEGGPAKKVRQHENDVNLYIAIYLTILLHLSVAVQ